MSLASRIEPFKAITFDRSRVGSLDSVVAPPYDLIGKSLQDELYARSPYNIVRLELSRESDPYGSAAAELARWLSEGILVQSDRPAVYHYTQKFDFAGRTLVRRGLIVRVRLEEFTSGRILPHERTFPKAKEDRLRLLQATRTNISSIFGLYRMPEGGLPALLDRIAGENPALTATDDRGIVNEIRAIDSSDAIDSSEMIALVQRALEAPRILIADGHHRYETALEYRRRLGPARSPSRSAADYVMMTLVAFDDPGLVILPTHRLVRRLASEAIANFAERCSRDFALEYFDNRDRFLEGLTARGRGAIGVALAGRPEMMLLRLKHPAALSAMMRGVHPAVRELEVSILHELILDHIFGLAPEEVRQGGNIEYTIDSRAALAEVASASAAGAFLMNPPSVDDIERVSGAGATMPEKSTYFYPKLLTGLVLNPLDD